MMLSPVKISQLKQLFAGTPKEKSSGYSLSFDPSAALPMMQPWLLILLLFWLTP
jgi:hypothetical protein